MNITDVYTKKGDQDTYYRDHVVRFEGDDVIFDTADGEYEVGRFPVSLLKEKLKEHEEK